MLEELISRGRSAWPGVEPAASLDASFAGREASELACPEDLYLAAACAEGDPAALRTFERAFGAEIQRAASRAPGLSPDDLAQKLRVWVLVGAAAGARPRIAEYSGRGPLRAWLRVVLARLVIEHARSRSHRATTMEAPGGSSALDELAACIPDPDVAYSKEVYRREIRLAVEDALRALTPIERAALRHRYVERLSIDRIALVHGVHRANAARRVRAAEERLGELVRGVLAERLGLEGSALASVMRLARSQLTLSIPRLLAQTV